MVLPSQYHKIDYDSPGHHAEKKSSIIISRYIMPGNQQVGNIISNKPNTYNLEKFRSCGSYFYFP